MALDLKRALAAYVSGRSGGWDSELKSPREEQRPASFDANSAPAAKAAAPYGVAVPERLGFERGPGTWRRRLAEASDD